MDEILGSSFRGLPLHLRVDAKQRTVNQLSLFGQSSRRIFAPYHTWEDYQAGMYHGRQSDAIVTAAQNILNLEDACRQWMPAVTLQWPIASSVNLTNSSLNKRAWIGQAACCLAVGATANETKRAWWQLTEPERVRANRCADEVIAAWQTAADVR